MMKLMGAILVAVMGAALAKSLMTEKELRQMGDPSDYTGTASQGGFESESAGRPDLSRFQGRAQNSHAGPRRGMNQTAPNGAVNEINREMRAAYENYRACQQAGDQRGANYWGGRYNQLRNQLEQHRQGWNR